MGTIEEQLVIIANASLYAENLKLREEIEKQKEEIKQLKKDIEKISSSFWCNSPWPVGG